MTCREIGVTQIWEMAPEDPYARYSRLLGTVKLNKRGTK